MATDVFFGYKLERGEDPLYENFPKKHFREMPVFRIGQDVINVPNRLSSVVKGIEKEGKDLFDRLGVGAYVLRAERAKTGLRFTESLTAMGILDKQLSITSRKFTRNPKYTGFRFTPKSGTTTTSTIKEYRKKQRAIFPSEKTITPILDSFFAQPDGEMEYAEHINFFGQSVSFAQGLNLTNFSSVLGDLDELLKEMNKEEEEKERAEEIRMVDGNKTETTLLAGIRTPFFYISRSYTQFCFHQEDFGLGSIAICFYADEDSYKMWIVFAPEDEEAFNNVCAKVYPQSFGIKVNCKNPVHQKNFIFDIRQFVEDGYFEHKPILIIQRAGDIVVTRPRAVHGGVNVGFTVNSAVNWAFSDYVYENIAYKKKAKIRRVKNGPIIKVPRNKWPRCCLNPKCTYHGRGGDFATVLVNNLDRVLESDKEPQKKFYEKLYDSAFRFELQNRSSKSKKNKRAGKEGVYKAREIDPDFVKKDPKPLTAEQKRIKTKKDLEAREKLHGRTKLMDETDENDE